LVFEEIVTSPSDPFPNIKSNDKGEPLKVDPIISPVEVSRFKIVPALVSFDPYH
jgi:hypothetical protein